MHRADARSLSCRASLSFAEHYRAERDRLARAFRGPLAADERCDEAASLLLRLIFACYLRSRNLSPRRDLSRGWLAKAIHQRAARRQPAGSYRRADAAPLAGGSLSP
ncbi:MAG: hypothetical protein HYS12_19270, partial [Planctomycetes bacterium]|nr:hypothetical protein [Planctomycetota bacterium]